VALSTFARIYSISSSFSLSILISLTFE
jgi:hypothetical protein